MRFGVFEADLRAGELRRNGQRVRLQEQPFQLLAMLLAKPGEVLTREELRARLWLSDTFVDFDHGLNAAIKRLRDALGDSAENPRFVETLARRGYRFIAPVEAGEERADPRVPRKHWMVLVAAAALLSIGLGVGWLAGRKSAASVRPTERHLTGNPQNDPVWTAALSPDGKYVAFADKAGLFLRILSTGETHAITEPDQLKTHQVSWFPDGTRVLATRGRWPENKPSLWSVPVLGGTARKLIEDAREGAVSPDGRQIAFTRGEFNREELWVMNAEGDGARKLTSAGGDYGTVIWSRDGRRLVVLRYSYLLKSEEDAASIEICDPATGKSETLLRNPQLWNALAWAADDRLIYSLGEPEPNTSDSNLWSRKIDPRSYKFTGDPVRLTSGPEGKALADVSADGKRLAYLRVSYSPQIYIAGVSQDHRHLGPAHRLGLAERRNHPYDWTVDGKSVIFTSDRDGVSHLFKQGLHELAPELLVGGERDVVVARLDPPGTSVLYLLGSLPSDTAKTVRLVRLSLAGGAPQTLLAEPDINNFQCARRGSGVCLFSQSSPERLTFYIFDPVSGKKKLWQTVQDSEWLLQNWTLSPDGSILAEAKSKRSNTSSAEIRLIRLDGSGERTLTLENWFAISCFDWAADGKSFWVSAADSSGTASLLNVTVKGEVTTALQENEMTLGWAIPSRDGRHVALWKGEQSANAWLLEGF